MTVMTISGHKSLAMMMRYYHAIKPHVKAVMDKLEAQ
jgi:integrase